MAYLRHEIRRLRWRRWLAYMSGRWAEHDALTRRIDLLTEEGE